MFLRHYAYQNKVTSKTTMSHVQFVTGILLISAWQKYVKQYFMLKQLYKMCFFFFHYYLATSTIN